MFRVPAAHQSVNSIPHLLMEPAPGTLPSPPWINGQGIEHHCQARQATEGRFILGAVTPKKATNAKQKPHQVLLVLPRKHFQGRFQDKLCRRSSLVLHRCLFLTRLQVGFCWCCSDTKEEARTHGMHGAAPTVAAHDSSEMRFRKILQSYRPTHDLVTMWHACSRVLSALQNFLHIPVQIPTCQHSPASARGRNTTPCHS